MDTKTLCLGALTKGDLSGYELKKMFEQCFRHFFMASYGSIYPALAELERKGRLDCHAVEQQGRPDKKVYSITAEGREALASELQAEPPRHRVRSEFLALMYFADLLEPERLEEVMDEMIAKFEHLVWDDFKQFEGNLDELTPGQRFALGYGQTVVTAALGYMRRQKDQLLRQVREPDQAAAPTDQPAAAGPRLAAAGD